MSFHPSSEFLLIPPFFSHFSPSSLCPSLHSPHDLSFIPVSFFFFLSSFFSLTSSLCLYSFLHLSSFLSLFYHSRPPTITPFICHLIPSSHSHRPSVPPFLHPPLTLSVPPFHMSLPSIIPLILVSHYYPCIRSVERRRTKEGNRKENERCMKTPQEITIFEKSAYLAFSHIHHEKEMLHCCCFFLPYLWHVAVFSYHKYMFLQAIVAQHGGAIGLIITSKLVRDNNKYKSSTSLESNLETYHKLKENMVKSEHSDSTDHIRNGSSPILFRFPILRVKVVIQPDHPKIESVVPYISEPAGRAL